MAYAILQARVNRRALRRERVFRDRLSPLDSYNDQEIIDRYRLSRELILEVLEVINLDIEHPTKRSCAIPSSLQLLTALRFYASGSFQTVTGDTHGLSKASVSRIIAAVSGSISAKLAHVIKFPATEAEKRQTIADFYKIAEFPNVIGVVDGSLIPISSPPENEHLFVSRKGFHSINIQGICDANLRFTNVVIKWPGSTHDAFIWANCRVAEEMEKGGAQWLLGDSGYPLRPWLLTPKLNVVTQGDRRYNRKLKTTRCTVERCFGVWKGRFRCLHKSGGPLLYTPSKAIKIIKATAILHNMCLNYRVPLEANLIDDLEGDGDGEVYGGPLTDGSGARDALILGKFSY